MDLQLFTQSEVQSKPMSSFLLRASYKGGELTAFLHVFYKRGPTLTIIIYLSNLFWLS